MARHAKGTDMREFQLAALNTPEILQGGPHAVEHLQSYIDECGDDGELEGKSLKDVLRERALRSAPRPPPEKKRWQASPSPCRIRFEVEDDVADAEISLRKKRGSSAPTVQSPRSETPPGSVQVGNSPAAGSRSKGQDLQGLTAVKKEVSQKKEPQEKLVKKAQAEAIPAEDEEDSDVDMLSSDAQSPEQDQHLEDEEQVDQEEQAEQHEQEAPEEQQVEQEEQDAQEEQEEQVGEEEQEQDAPAHGDEIQESQSAVRASDAEDSAEDGSGEPVKRRSSATASAPIHEEFLAAAKEDSVMEDEVEDEVDLGIGPPAHPREPTSRLDAKRKISKRRPQQEEDIVDVQEQKRGRKNKSKKTCEVEDKPVNGCAVAEEHEADVQKKKKTKKRKCEVEDKVLDTGGAVEEHEAGVQEVEEAVLAQDAEVATAAGEVDMDEQKGAKKKRQRGVSGKAIGQASESKGTGDTEPGHVPAKRKRGKASVEVPEAARSNQEDEFKRKLALELLKVIVLREERFSSLLQTLVALVRDLLAPSGASSNSHDCLVALQKLQQEL